MSKSICRPPKTYEPPTRTQSPAVAPSSYGVDCGLAAIDDRDDRKSLQCRNSESQFKLTDGQDSDAKRQKTASQNGGGARNPADLPGIRHLRWPHSVRRQGHGQEVTRDHYDDHQHRRQNRMSGHDQTDREQHHLHDLLEDGVERVSRECAET